ncbi:MAG: PadR family transcriptional regulator [Acidimicrobiales bacterium]
MPQSGKGAATHVLELAILGLLKEQDLHGYELKKRLATMLGFASGVSFGSLYPALGRLERAGALRAVTDAGSVMAIPLTGSLSGELAAARARARNGVARSGRSRKVYAITERGHELFAELLAAHNRDGEDDRSFSLRLAFARYLPAEDRLGLLERRRAYLIDRRSRLRGRVRDRLDAYTSSLVEHDREATEHDLSWIDRLIAVERAEGGPPSSSERTPAPPAPAPPAPAPPAPALGALASPRAARPSISGLRPAVTQEDTVT